MTTPIPDLPETPLPSQNRPDFEETVETFLLALGPWADAANVLGGEMEALAGGASDSVDLANFAVPFPEWQNFSSRSLATATGMVDGTAATVSADDTGTHTEHFSFGGDDVPNAGRYVYFTAVSAWQRIGDLDSTLSAASATAAEGFKELASDEADRAEAAVAAFGAPDLLNATSGRTLLKSDGSAIGTSAMATQSDGINVLSATFGVWTVMSTSVALSAGRRARITMKFRPIDIPGSCDVGIGFGTAGSRTFLAMRQSGTVFLSNDAKATGTILGSTVATNIFANGNDCTVVVNYDGAGNASAVLTTPNGTSPAYTFSVPEGPVWLAVATGNKTVRFVSSLKFEQLGALEHSLYESSLAASLAAGAIVPKVNAISSILEISRIGRQTDPVTGGTAFNRTFVFADPTTTPWLLKRFQIVLAADAPVYVKRFSVATGLQIGVDIHLAGVAGLNTFTATDIPNFGGNAGEYLGWYSSQSTATGAAVADGSGWYSTNGANAGTIGTFSGGSRLEASFEIETAYATPSRVKRALLGGARAIVLPAELAWSPVTFGVLPDNTITHDYNPLDYIPISKPSAAGFLFYVDGVNGLDTNDGLTPAAAFKSLYKALHNRSGTIWVQLMSDLTLAESGVGATIAASAVVIVPFNRKRCTISTKVFPGSWTLVAGTTATYETTFTTAPAGLWDMATLTADGFGTRLAASLLTGELAAGRCKITGTTVRVRLPDSRAPDNELLCLADGDHIAVAMAGQKVWTDCIDFEGGASFWITNAGTRSGVYVANSHMRYGTKNDDMFHNYGVCDSILCKVFGYETASDLFGYNGNARGIEIDCGGVNAGYTADDSANISTLHGGARAIRVTTRNSEYDYTKSYSRPVHDVTGSFGLCLGIRAGLSLSGVEYERVAFVAANPGTDATKLYLAFCEVAEGSHRAYGSNAQGIIYSYRTDKNGVPDYGTPDVRDWWPFA